MKRTGPTNPLTKALIEELGVKARKEENAFMKEIANRLSKPTRARAAINLDRISRLTKKGETVMVPGKVLAKGALAHPVTISALEFSESARKKIAAAGGKAVKIEEFIEKSKNARILV